MHTKRNNPIEDFQRQQQLKLPAIAMPKCPRCQNWGYVNCPEAQLPDGSGDYIAIAFEKGTACTCAAGQEFANFQLQWLDPGKQTLTQEPA